MKLTELIHIKYPIIQGAMAHIARPSLVSAVSNAGGLGILASAGLTGEELRDAIQETKHLTNQPFGVNLMLQMPNIKELVDVIVDERVAVVTTGAGNPAPIIPILKEAGIKVLPVIASVRHAKKMATLGADGLIVEGQESGGHIGTASTLTLIPQVVDAVDLPVIAAGGIADGRGVAAMFALGAVGVQLGTVFLASEECPIPLEYKQAVVEATDQDTVVMGRLYNRAVRVLQNDFSSTCLETEKQGVSPEEWQKVTSGSLLRAVQGESQTGAMMAGEISGLVHDIRPVKEIMEHIITTYIKALSQLNKEI
ncbi:NAD(P)H-dependent flavin oxidoreductase [Atopobacter phocae]|uniref:NAD(P)H-dependent flavin oxidoreductase n=1 Tax=Atopobacter phocae TaxID=136492 RepID=UPI00046FE287|nr:nitronate monooxygenase [Atopobacter phocae]